MRKKIFAKVIAGFALFALLFAAVFGWSVHALWNVLMPALFGLPRISFWQALGLLTLSWLLFGGWRGMPIRRRSWGGGPRGRWEGLTAEEREQVARRMRSCGWREAAPAEGPPSPAS
jgi:type VI protein secretion system component VasK